MAPLDMPWSSRVMIDPGRLQWLKGSITDLTRDLQLCLLIQPNCPGCHTHAIPVANELWRRTTTPSIPISNDAELGDDISDKFNVYCISTAFEDFEYNTVESARLLLEGSLIGDARRRLGPNAPHIPQMPLAHDMVVRREEAPQALLDLALETTLAAAREQMAAGLHLAPPGFFEEALAKVGPQVLLPNSLAETFYAVAAQGTPTWIVHDRKSGRLLDRARLGPLSLTDLTSWIKTILQSRVE